MALKNVKVGKKFYLKTRALRSSSSSISHFFSFFISTIFLFCPNKPHTWKKSCSHAFCWEKLEQKKYNNMHTFLLTSIQIVLKKQEEKNYVNGSVDVCKREITRQLFLPLLLQIIQEKKVARVATKILYGQALSLTIYYTHVDITHHGYHHQTCFFSCTHPCFLIITSALISLFCFVCLANLFVQSIHRNGCVQIYIFFFAIFATHHPTRRHKCILVFHERYERDT